VTFNIMTLNIMTLNHGKTLTNRTKAGPSIQL
jgi:hypothetical protein